MRITHILFLCLTLSACAAPSLDAGEASRYNSIEQLVQEEIGETKTVHFNSLTLNPVAKPFAFSRDYCVHNGGSFVKVEDADRIGNYYIVQQDNRRKYHLDRLNGLFGLFECRSNGRVSWAINIQHNGVETTPKWHTSNTDMQITPFSADAYAQRQELHDREEATARKRQLDMEAAARKRQLDMERAFINAATTSKAVGIEICSKDNRFGYVERIAADRIQVRVIGQIYNRPNYYFYNDTDRGRWEKAERIIWDASDNWGKCVFDI